MRRLVVVIVLAAAALAPACARGDDTYTVESCGPTGSIQGWSFSNAGTTRAVCPNPGIVGSAPAAESTPLGGFNVTFTAPPGTSIVGYRLWRTVRLSGPWNYTLYRGSADGVEEHIVERCWTIGGCSALGDGHVGAPADVTDPGIDTPALVLHVDCNPGNCPGGNPSNVTVRRMQVDLADRSDPTFVGAPSGDLLDPTQPVAGVRTVSFSASDQGSGVYRALLEVDGSAVTSGVVDANGGKCDVPFTTIVPCRLNTSGTLSFDTATLLDGVHSMRLVVTDATETNEAVYGPVQVRTANQAAVCDPAVTDKSTPVSAGLKGTSHTAITRTSGRVTIVGRVAGAGGGVLVDLLARERRTGAVPTLLGSGTTAADGTFSLIVPAGPSRVLHAAYRLHPTDAAFACSRTLTVRVPATATLHAAPRRLHPGARVRLYGALGGGRIPARGKLIDLQAREQGRWHTFASVRTKRSGSFTTHYRFHRGAPRRTYPMRVRVRPEAAYPYALGYSRAVRIRVR